MAVLSGTAPAVFFADISAGEVLRRSSFDTALPLVSADISAEMALVPTKPLSSPESA